MAKNTKGGIIVVLIVCILGLCCGSVFGMNHIGEEYCKELVPTSLTSPASTVNVIDEQNFTPQNITVSFPKPKTTTVKKNYTNYTSTNNTTSTSDSNENSYSDENNYNTNYNYTPQTP